MRGEPKHGWHGTPEYKAWQAMKARCLNADHPSYPDYGARGILVCSQWLNSFQNFIDDIGPKPSPKHTLDRVDNDGHYEPGNVRWATRLEQQANRRTTIRLEFQGQTLTTYQASQLTGLTQELIRQRLSDGWSVERTLSEPRSIKWLRKTTGSPSSLPSSAHSLLEC